MNIRYKHIDDYYEHFGEIFEEAVSCRLRSNNEVSVSLSSGLDSTIIAALASNKLSKADKKLFAYTSVPKNSENRFDQTKYYSDESELTRKFLLQYPEIQHEFIADANEPVLQTVLKLLQIHGFPGRALSNMFWVQAILEKSKRIGANVMLTGQGGNLTLSWPNIYVINNPNPTDVLKYGFKTIFNSILSVSGGSNKNVRYQMLKDVFYDIELNSKVCTFRRADNPFFESARLQYMAPGKTDSGAYWHELGGYYGVEVRDPTLDKRVIEFCFSIPKDVFMDNNQSRLLAKRTFSNLLPREILYNTKRGIQGTDIVDLVKSESASIQTILTNNDEIFATNTFDTIKVLYMLQQFNASNEPLVLQMLYANTILKILLFAKFLRLHNI